MYSQWLAAVVTRRRFVLQAGFDGLCWLVALPVATWLRYEFHFEHALELGVLIAALVAVVVQTVIGRIAGLYIHRFRYGSMDEMFAAAAAIIPVTVSVALLNRFVLGHPVPVSASLIAGLLAFLGMSIGRFGWRLWLDHARLPDLETAERVLVFGAGDGGLQVVSAMLGQHHGTYHPVGLLDDNLGLRNLRLRGVKVLGTREDLVRIAEEREATTLVIAIPSATGEMLRELSALADEAGLKTLVLPPVSDLFGTHIGVSDLRPLTEADLLGRREIGTDIDAIAGYLTGKRVLVTGAGGSIGSELCRQLSRLAPAELVMLDRDESALQAVELSIEGRSLLQSENLVVACIRDLDRMREVFDRHRPQVVFHAAALKHLPLLEMHPDEGWKTNVIGTDNMLSVAAEFGVERFVNISTDKAADASSVLGRTKRLAERLTAKAASDTGLPYLSVRFGNVLGSRGSVLPLFRTQIENDGPVTVTHPEVTRFFMTIPEACELVIQAGAVGTGGDVMVLDMGEPVRIADLARRLIKESGKRIELVFTGLRPGEKMHEILFGPDELPQPSAHPLIATVAVPPISLAQYNAMASGDIDLRLAVNALADSV